MKTIFTIQALKPNSFRWTTRRGKNVVNHSYNKRRQALKQLLAFLGSIAGGNFEIKGLSVEEEELVREAMSRW